MTQFAIFPHDALNSGPAAQLAVPDLATLDLVVPDALLLGTRVHVATVKEDWILCRAKVADGSFFYMDMRPAYQQTDDTQPRLMWVRSGRGNAVFTLQANWYVDAGIGDDENDGTQATQGAGRVGPLRTVDEQLRRIAQNPIPEGVVQRVRAKGDSLQNQITINRPIAPVGNKGSDDTEFNRCQWQLIGVPRLVGTSVLTAATPEASQSNVRESMAATVAGKTLQDLCFANDGIGRQAWIGSTIGGGGVFGWILDYAPGVAAFVRTLDSSSFQNNQGVQVGATINVYEPPIIIAPTLIVDGTRCRIALQDLHRSKPGSYCYTFARGDVYAFRCAFAWTDETYFEDGRAFLYACCFGGGTARFRGLEAHEERGGTHFNGFAEYVDCVLKLSDMWFDESFRFQACDVVFAQQLGIRAFGLTCEVDRTRGTLANCTVWGMNRTNSGWTFFLDGAGTFLTYNGGTQWSLAANILARVQVGSVATDYANGAALPAKLTAGFAGIVNGT